MSDLFQDLAHCLADVRQQFGADFVARCNWKMPEEVRGLADLTAVKIHDLPVVASPLVPVNEVWLEAEGVVVSTVVLMKPVELEAPKEAAPCSP